MNKKIIGCLFLLCSVFALGVDYRPDNIKTLEAKIAREKDRDKVAPMVKEYNEEFNDYLNSIANNEELIFNLGDQYFKNNRYEAAKNIFSKNIDSSRNLFGAGTTSRFLGDYNKAIDYYTESLSKEPLIPEAYLGRGLAYRNIGEYKKAIEDFNTYKSYYDNESVYLALGDIYMAMGNYGKARGILEVGRGKFPNSKEIQEMLITIYSK